MSLMLAAPSAIAAAIETSAAPRSKRGDFPALRNAAPSHPVSPAWSAALRSRIAPACPTRPVPSADLQGMVPPVKLHGEERSSSRGYRRGNP
jgi:hypothetical protein